MSNRKIVYLISLIIISISMIIGILSPATGIDPYEPNDSFGTAYTITKGTYSCDMNSTNTQDWYKLDLVAYENVSFTAVVNYYYWLNLELELYDGTETLITSSKTNRNVEEVFYTNGVTPTTIYLRIYSITSLSYEEVYTLYVADYLDPYEENDDSTNAVALVKGEYPSLRLQDTEDWYKIYMAVGENLSAKYSTGWDYNNPNFDIYLYGPTMVLLTSSTQCCPIFERVILSYISEAGWYYVRIVAVSGAKGNYTLTLETQNDLYEPNNDFGNAYPLTKGSYNNLLLKDDDYFAINIEAGGNLSTYLYWDYNKDVDFDLEVYSPSFALIGESVHYSSDSERIQLINLPAGSYFIRVFIHSGIAQVYSLSLSTLMDDGYEDNDDWTTAKSISLGSEYWSMQYYDDDFFNLSLSAGDSVDLHLYNFGNNLDLELWDNSGTLLQGSYDTSTNSEHIILTNTPYTGCYYIRVFSSIPQGYTSYWFETTIIFDDTFEENDNFGSAKPISRTSYINLAYWDDDYFSIGLSSGDNLSIRLQTSNWVDLKVEFYSPDQVLLQSIITDSYILFIPQVTQTGIFYIRISNGSMNSFDNYTLTLGYVSDDNFEDNNDFSSATSLTKGTYFNLAWLDEDWYAITLNEGENLSISIDMTSGNLNIELRNSANTMIASATTWNDPEILNALFLSAGVYYIRIYNGTNNVQCNYTMIIGSVWDDSYDPNDNLESAALLTLGTYTNLAWYDQDWYKIALNAGDNISIILHNTGSNILSIRLLNASGIVMKQPNYQWNNPKEIFYIPIPTTDMYYIQVYNYESGYTNYTLTLSIKNDDLYEPNDVIGDAIGVSKTTYTSLAWFDTDFYKITLAENENVSVLINNYANIRLGIRIYNSTQALIGSINRDSSCELLYANAPETGSYYIEIYRQSGEKDYSNYTMILTSFMDDGFEQNDNNLQGKNITKSESTYNLVYADEDWFNITLNWGDNISVSLGTESGADLDMMLYDPNMAIIAESHYSMIYATIENLYRLNVTIYGNYYLRVYHVSGNAYSKYTLQIKNCIDDTYENNDDAEYAANMVKQTNFISLVLLDHDWFKVSLTAGDNLSVIMSNIYLSCYLEIYSPSLSLLKRRASSYNYIILALLNSETDTGDYYIHCYSTGWTGSYQFYIGNIQDDPYENNDALSSAYIVEKSSYVGINYDEDWYGINLATGENFSALLRGSFSNFDLELYSPTGTLLMSSNAEFFNSVYLTSSIGGYYYLRVFSLVNDIGQYELIIDDFYDDPFEENDNSLSATEIWRGGSNSSLVFGTDEDWFKLYCDVGSNFTFFIQVMSYSYDPITVNLQLYDTDQSTLLQTATTLIYPGKIVFKSDITTAGFYYFRVYLQSGNWVEYDWDCSNATDEDEPNNQYEDAYEIELPDYKILLIIDEDWYAFNASAGESIYVYANPLHANHPYTFEFYDSDGLTLHSTSEWKIINGFNVSLAYYANIPTTGTYYLKNYRNIMGDVGSFAIFSKVTVSHPTNITCKGTEGYAVTWMPTDYFALTPEGYYALVFIDSVQVANLSWSPECLLSYPIQGLVPGVHNFTIMVYNAYGVWVSDEVGVTITGNAAPTVSSISDFSFNVTNSSASLNWTVIDADIASPQYRIRRNGVIVDQGTWVSGMTINYSIGSRLGGIYQFTFEANDGFGATSTDIVMVTVNNMLPSLTMSPPDLTLLVGSTNIWLNWTVIDTEETGATYQIVRNGVFMANNTWSSGSNIQYNIGTLPQGTYNFTITFYDGYGGFTYDVVIITVTTTITPPTTSNIPPSLTAPDDISFVNGTVSHQIEWRVTDGGDTGTYIILRNGTQIATGTWVSGQKLEIVVDGLAPGNYLYTITVTDSAGASDSDDVFVTVTSDVDGVPSWNLTQILMYSVPTAGVAVILMTVLLRKKPKPKLDDWILKV